MVVILLATALDENLGFFLFLSSFSFLSLHFLVARSLYLDKNGGNRKVIY